MYVVRMQEKNRYVPSTPGNGYFADVKAQVQNVTVAHVAVHVMIYHSSR